jgi:hypothetical protein
MSESPVKSVDNTLMIPLGKTKSNLIRLKGRVLTIVDSALPPGPQNKATKDLIRMALDELYRDIQSIVPLPEGQSWDVRASLGGDGIQD